MSLVPDLTCVSTPGQCRRFPVGRVGTAGKAARPAAGYGLTSKFWVVQPALVLLPPAAASIELPQTRPVAPVAGELGSGVAAPY